MLLSSVILVLREVLEAALLFSLLMALSKRMGISSRWVFVSLVAGLLGAAIYGFNIDNISEMFEGVGQELVNALLQIFIYALLCGIASMAMIRIRGAELPVRTFTAMMALGLALAIVREGSEIMIYLSGFLQVEDLRGPVLAGSAIGTGIGVSVGAVFYFALLNFGRRFAMVTGAGLLALVAAGMASQAALLLIQADWLPSRYPLWDSSWLVSEESVTGQLLYALIGYEATPTSLQVGVYIGSIVLLTAVALLFSRIGMGRRSVGSAHA
jgi:high-affinity iron transporter